jgi:hypothetical protein
MTVPVREPSGGRALGIGLWITAVFVMLGSAVFQRLTGPTHPLRGSFVVAGEEHRYRLTRSGWSFEDERVAVSLPSHDVTGTLYFKRHKTDDPMTALPLRVEDGELAGYLPQQPAAGKLEYTIVLESPAGRIRVPDRDENVVIRFKDHVPLWVLLPHVFFMFFAVLFGIRAGLSALFQPAPMERYAWVALLLMSIGGMVLGPVVQKLAFGAFWTGFPFGYDLTDNKTLLMWIVWVAACGLFLARRSTQPQRRLAVVLATVVMLAVYLIPHSMRGSELDYGELDRGVPAEEAVGQGG